MENNTAIIGGIRSTEGTHKRETHHAPHLTMTGATELKADYCQLPLWRHTTWHGMSRHAKGYRIQWTLWITLSCRCTFATKQQLWWFFFLFCFSHWKRINGNWVECQFKRLSLGDYQGEQHKDILYCSIIKRKKNTWQQKPKSSNQAFYQKHTSK